MPHCEDVPLTERLAVNVGEAARLLGCCRDTVYELIYDHKLRSVSVGRRRLISVASLREYLGDDIEETP